MSNIKPEIPEGIAKGKAKIAARKARKAEKKKSCNPRGDKFRKARENEMRRILRDRASALALSLASAEAETETETETDTGFDKTTHSGVVASLASESRAARGLGTMYRLMEKTYRMCPNCLNSVALEGTKCPTCDLYVMEGRIVQTGKCTVCGKAGPVNRECCNYSRFVRGYYQHTCKICDDFTCYSRSDTCLACEDGGLAKQAKRIEKAVRRKRHRDFCAAVTSAKIIPYAWKVVSKASIPDLWKTTFGQALGRKTNEFAISD